jgi:hydrogenase maturation factor
MCVSRFHRVVSHPEAGMVLAVDYGGGMHKVSLLALDGPPPEPGEWLVVHSGYAIDRAPGGVDELSEELAAVDIKVVRP